MWLVLGICNEIQSSMACAAFVVVPPIVSQSSLIPDDLGGRALKDGDPPRLRRKRL